MKEIETINILSLNNFPFIENDFDAITYYELLCKVASTINDMVSDINEVINGFETINNTVSNLQTNVERLNNEISTFESTINNRFIALSTALESDIQSKFEILDEEITTELTQIRNDFVNLRTEILSIVNQDKAYTDEQITNLRNNLTIQINRLQNEINDLDIVKYCYNPVTGTTKTLQETLIDMYNLICFDPSDSAVGGITAKHFDDSVATNNITVSQIDNYTMAQLPYPFYSVNGTYYLTAEIFDRFSANIFEDW